MMAWVRNNCSEMGNSGDYFIQERNESLLNFFISERQRLLGVSAHTGLPRTLTTYG